MDSKKPVMLTIEGLNKLETELKHLKEVKRAEVAEKIKSAMAFGDLSENSEYDEAKTEQGKLYSKIAELKAVIAGAEIIEGSGRAGMVSLGSKVKVRDKQTKEEDTYEIVGSQEADPMQFRVSDDSPIGSALLDRKKGDTVTVHAPAGDFELEMLSISH